MNMRMMMAAALLVLVACGDEPVCDDGAVRTCLCSDGAPGLSYCAEDLRSWEACSCEEADADADVDSDGDADADADAEADGDEDQVEDADGDVDELGDAEVDAEELMPCDRGAHPADDSISISTQAELDELEGYTSIGTDLMLNVGPSTTAITSLRALHCLESISGSLGITLPYLDSLEGLESLSWIGRLTIGSTRVTSLEGLGPVELLDDLSISGNSYLTSLEALSSLRRVREDLHIDGNKSMEHLGLNELECASGYYYVVGNPQLPTCEAEDLLYRLRDLDCGPADSLIADNGPGVCP